MTAQAETPRCAISEEGKILYANDAFYSLVELTRENMENASEIFKFSADILGRGKDFSYLPSGDHDVHLRGNPIITEFHFDWVTSPDGTRTLIASVVDETKPQSLSQDLENLMERIRTKRQNILDHQGFSSLFDLTHDIMVVTDTAGNILSANRAFGLSFSKDSHALVGLSFLDMFPMADRHLIRSTMQEFALSSENADSDHVTRFESQMPCGASETRWVEWRQKYADGRIYFAGRDVTDIKRKQDDLLRREHQLLEAEAIGRMGHWRWPIGEEKIAWSDEIFRIFGLDRRNFTPTIDTLSGVIHKRDIGRVIQAFQRAMIEEQNYDMEFRITRPDGNTRYIHCEGRCEKDETGDVIALYGIMQDMTERVLYEQELKEAKNASEQAYAAKSKFLANMSHELRTPLNAIIGFSEMMENQMLGPIFNEKYLEYAKSIRESGEHLLDLISDILDMSKIEAGKYTLDLEAVNLKDTIRRAAHMIEARVQEQNIRLRLPAEEETDVILNADRRGLMQILLNLLSNAVKFTPKGGAVWVEYKAEENAVTLKIGDTGIGIPPNKLASVLRPFEQISSHYTRDHEGTGLGLSITKELVELHGGKIQIESTVGLGTTVSVRLPYGR